MTDLDAARFWSSVRKSDGCWEWIGRIAPNGYGAFSDKGKNWKAHRYSWTLHFGPIPEGMFVCHHCDNPPCVRPDHLFLGTHEANMADRQRKGRTLIGENVGSARLDWELVREIRSLPATVTWAEIARRYGIGRTTVAWLLTGQTWPDPDYVPRPVGPRRNDAPRTRPTHCKRGHPYPSETTGTARKCRECHNANHRARERELRQSKGATQ